MPSDQPRPDRPRKHLMTPGQPRLQRRDPMSIGTVQRWVMSILAATTIMHLAIGLTIAGVVSDRPDSRIGLLVIGALCGIGAMVAALLIHGRRPLSPWLLLGLVPAAVGAYVAFH